jgi:flagellar biosynthesis protein FlhF
MTSHTASPMAEDSDIRDQLRAGVRTYRGRKLEDILPRIREDLGPDAVILREREGLVGGIGGFFAQRFVEVDARAGGPSIDLYDDEDEGALADEPRVTDARAGRPDPVAAAGPLAAEPDPFAAEPIAAEPDPFAAEPIAAEPDPFAGQFAEDPFADDFVRHLRAAASAWTEQDAPIAELTEHAGADVEPVPAPEPSPAPDAARAQRSSPRQARKPAPRRSRKTAARAASEPHTTSAAPAPPAAPAELPAPATAQLAAAELPAPATAPLAAAGAPAAAARSRTFAPVAPVLGATPGPPAPASRPRPPLRPLALAGPDEAALPPASPLSLQIPAPPAPAPRPASGSAAAPRRGRLRRALARRFGRAHGSPTWSAVAGRPLDAAAAAAIASDLIARGGSDRWVSILIAGAAAHGSPLTGERGLREAARRELARSIVEAPQLPVNGAAVAFVGAGGSGKTRCTAALAAAYARASTLSVSVMSLGAPDGGRALGALLREDRIPVHGVSGATAARAVGEARTGGLVVLDTVAVAPGDATAIQALLLELAPLELDAIYLTMPATLGASAARSALASFMALGPAAVAITHADETDQLGVATELTATQRVPLAFLHAGTDLHTSLSPAEPSAIARRLLP